jgi:hypothetical protein
MRERLALNVMFHIGMSFRDPSGSISSNQISDRISIPSIALTRVVSALEGAGLILSTENETLLPGREMSLEIEVKQGHIGSRAGRRMSTYSAMNSTMRW